MFFIWNLHVSRVVVWDRRTDGRTATNVNAVIHYRWLQNNVHHTVGLLLVDRIEWSTQYQSPGSDRRTDRQTDRHLSTTNTALMHSIARIKTRNHLEGDAKPAELEMLVYYSISTTLHRRTIKPGWRKGKHAIAVRVWMRPLSKKFAANQRHATSYWWWIVTVAVSFIVSEIFSRIWKLLWLTTMSVCLSVCLSVCRQSRICGLYENYQTYERENLLQCWDHECRLLDAELWRRRKSKMADMTANISHMSAYVIRLQWNLVH